MDEDRVGEARAGGDPVDEDRAGEDRGDRHLDGNAVAGTLDAALGAEVSAALRRCASCGDCAPLAEMLAYEAGPGAVLRCRRCGEVGIRVVVTPTRVLVELRR